MLGLKSQTPATHKMAAMLLDYIVVRPGVVEKFLTVEIALCWYGDEGSNVKSVFSAFTPRTKYKNEIQHNIHYLLVW